jgi:hypothetical protein
MANLSGVKLADVALQHKPLTRKGKLKSLLPEGPVVPLPTFAAVKLQ